MNELEKFLDLVQKNKLLDPFYESQTWKDFFSWLSWEVNEAFVEYEKWDHKELEKELWDVAWDFFLLLEKLQDEKKISVNNVFASINDKMSRRKSFLLEWKKVSKQDAMEIWNNAKSKEWYDNSRLWHE